MDTLQSSAVYRGTKRVSLTRIWNPMLQIITILMYYPSSADARNNDKTINSCIRICKNNNYGGIIVFNIEDSVKQNITEYYNVVIAWGSKINRKKSIDIINKLSLSQELLCFTQLRDGRPGLPTRLSNNTRIRPFILI